MGGGEVEEGGGERVKFSVDHLWLVYQKTFHLVFWIMVVRDAPLTATCAIERAKPCHGFSDYILSNKITTYIISYQRNVIYQKFRMIPILSN